MTDFRSKAVSLVATAKRMAVLKGAESEATLLAQARPQLIETGYDNWNGGTDFYTLTLEVPVEAYMHVEASRDKLEASILQRVQDLTRSESNHSITSVVISPELIGAEATQADDHELVNDPVPTFWAAGHFRLFISHCSTIKKSAHNLKAALASHQIAAFVAHDDIEPTREWQAEIESALRTMDALVAIITPDFVGSRWCDQEVGIAIGREKLVVPIRKDADPHGFLGKFQGVQSANQTAPMLAERVFEILLKNERSSVRMTDSLIERLATVKSWESARAAMSLLEKTPRLNRIQAARLMASVQENVKVAESHGVPARIEALVARVGEVD